MKLHLEERQGERDMAIAAIAEVVSVIERERRSPDQWERVFLFDALMSFFSGCYQLSVVRAHLALTPVTERSQTVPLPEAAVYGQCDLSLLNKIFEVAQHEPVKKFPSFGPVEIPLPPTGQGKAWLK